MTMHAMKLAPDFIKEGKTYLIAWSNRSAEEWVIQEIERESGWIRVKSTGQHGPIDRSDVIWINLQQVSEMRLAEAG